MNVLFLINIDMSQNGPSVHLLNDIMASFRKKGHSIIRIERKFGCNSWKTSRKENNNEIVFAIETLPPKSRNYAMRYIDDLRYVIQCRRIAKKIDFDAVFLQSCNCAGFHLYWLKQYKNSPVYYNVQDIFPLDMVYEGTMGKRNPMYWAFDIIQKYAYKKSKCVITISEDMKDTLVNLGVPTDKVKVIHNWAYTDEYNPDYDRQIINQFFSDSKYHVVYAGNIGVAQGVENLIEACPYLQQFKDISVMIIGGGSRLKKCKDKAKELQLTNVSFFDLVPQYLAQYVYNNADINIVTLAEGIIHTSLPSKTAACYKSMKPVVYCVEDEAKTIKKLVKSNTKIFQCNPGNPRKLAETILKVKEMSFSEQEVRPFEEVLVPQRAEAYVSIIEGE